MMTMTELYHLESRDDDTGGSQSRDYQGDDCDKWTGMLTCWKNMIMISGKIRLMTIADDHDEVDQ